jgi:hypothetical protein
LNFDREIDPKSLVPHRDTEGDVPYGVDKIGAFNNDDG